jgi:hypothetical protein
MPSDNPARAFRVAALCLFLLAAPLAGSNAHGAALAPCPKPPAGPEYEGDATLVTGGALRSVLNGAGVRQELVRPANAFTGRPTFPVKSASMSPGRAKAGFGGALRLDPKHRGRTTRIGGFELQVRPGERPRVLATVAGRRVGLFNLSRGKARFDSASGVLNLRAGPARLTARASRIISSRLGLRGARALSPGRSWGTFSAFVSRNKKVDDPEAETPVEPPLLARPDGAADISSATIKWRVRESFIRYVNVGTGTSVSGGATADPPEQIGGTAPLVYSFNFPFSSGWTLPGGDTALYGSGTVGFRHCRNTINFTVSDPEVELKSSGISRLIFRVNGTDGTAFPDSRAVMVDLLPGAASVQGNTTTYSDIPAYVPQEATGIFANFYPPYPGDPNAPNADLSRFGSVTVSYTTG